MPSANHIDSDLFTNGGNVLVSVTGADHEFFFTFQPIPKITGVSPVFIFADDSVTLTISGDHFTSQDTTHAVVKLVSTDFVIQKVPASITATELTVQVSPHEFLSRSRVDIQVSFDGEFFYQSPTFISVAKRFELDRLSQQFISSSANKVLIYVVEDSESAGGLWDTQANLK